MARSEPTVPLSVFNQMFETLVALFSKEAEARREHEQRIVDTIAEALKPAPLPDRPFTGPAWVSEAAEDLEYAKRAELDPALIKQLEAEADFERPIAEIFTEQ